MDGVFLAYDLLDADPHFLMEFEQRSPGQTLISHASCWTQDFPFTSDISTFLYQTSFSPWSEGRLHIDPATQQAQQLPADLTTPVETLANAIVTSEVRSEAVQDGAELTRFASVVGPPADSGRRPRFYFGSPVQSSRFF